MIEARWPDQFVEIGGKRTRYWQAGASGEAVVLIHGLGGSIEQWWANIGPLSQTHRVFCLDMLGCGKTEPAVDNDYSLESLARFIDTFARETGLSSFSLVGLSMGGAICLRYALAYPQKITKLVLVGSAGLGSRMAIVFRVLALPFADFIMATLSRRRFSTFVRSMVYDPSIVTEEILDFYYPLIKAPATRHAFLDTLRTNCSFWGLRRHVRDSVVGRLHTLQPPTLIIWGRQDNHMPVANAHEAVKKIPCAKLVLLDSCRHNPQFEKAPEFNRIVEEYLRGVQT